jgi:Cd2+/Zn2+-exporting ATPase
VLAGNTKLLKKFNISYDKSVDEIIDTIVVTAIDGKYAGYITIADEIKEDAQQAIQAMHAIGIRQTVMLSGDKNSITQQVAKAVGIDTAFGDLLPEQKVLKVEELKTDKAKVIAFVGDGINDAPVLALSDVGIAMGGLGSDAAIETADVVIQTDQPSKIVTAIQIGNATKKIVWQNISLAFGVKVIVLVLGAGGLATMWEAVFADVGVALLAILNAVRIQRMKF